MKRVCALDYGGEQVSYLNGRYFIARSGIFQIFYSATPKLHLRKTARTVATQSVLEMAPGERAGDLALQERGRESDELLKRLGAIVRDFSIFSSMEEEEMATEPKDAPLAQTSAEIEATLAPPVAFTVIHSDESAAEAVEPAGAPDVEGARAIESEVVEASDAPGAEIQQGAAREEDEAAAARAAPVGDTAPATVFERDFAAARDRMVAINVKVLQAFLANAETNLDFLAALPSVRSLSELIDLQSKFACKQVDAMVGPAAEIGVMTQNTMASAVDAMRDRITRSVGKLTAVR